MFKPNEILHFDVDEAISPYLTTGKKTDQPINPETAAGISGKEAVKVITFKSQSEITRGVLQEFPGLKLLVARTVGTNNVDPEACKEKGVSVYRIPDYGSQTVAEHALALLLSGARNITQADRFVRSGVWDYRKFQGITLHGKTGGVIGTGRIGLSFIRLVKAFGVKVLAYDMVRNQDAAAQLGFEYVTLPELLKNSQFISIHVPLLPQTKHLIAEQEMRLIPDNSILVNTSRGAVIDTDALVRYAKKFRAICLDVVEGEEKFSAGHPILSLPNLVVTPHIGFFTDESVRNIARITNENIDNFQKGIDNNRVI